MFPFYIVRSDERLSGVGKMGYGLKLLLPGFKFEKSISFSPQGWLKGDRIIRAIKLGHVTSCPSRNIVNGISSLSDGFSRFKILDGSFGSILKSYFVKTTQ